MIRKKLLKLSICIVIAVFSVFIFKIPSFACTGIYVGSQANDQGTSIIARSSDTGTINLPNFVNVYGGNDGMHPEFFLGENGFKYYPKDNFYRFVCAQNSDCGNGDCCFAFAINECGVSISATVSGYCSPTALKFNPITEHGLCEDILPSIVGSSAKTAREGIELLAKIIDEEGSWEDNIIMVSDQKECWYMEIYGGHQYCAVKAPDDCVACIGNEYALTTEYATCADAICSPGLFSVPAENNFASYDADGKMNLFNTYVGHDMRYDFSHLRTWIGHKVMAPSTAGTYSTYAELPLFYKPDSKISVGQVAELLRNRFEGTQYCPETNPDDYIRVIATEEQTKTHILQTYRDVPPEIAAISWFCPTNAEFGAFTPLSACETKFENAYRINEPTYEYDKDNICYPMKDLNALCAQNRKQTSKGVREYLKFLENYSTQIMPDLIKAGKKDKINDFCSFMQKRYFEDVTRLKDDVNWFYMCKTITMKNDVDQHKSEFIVRDIPMFTSNVDLLFFAKMTGWNIDEFTVRDREQVNDPNKTIAENNVESGGKEAYVKLSKDNNTVEVRTTNGKIASVGQLVVNGQTKECKPLFQNGKVYAPFEITNVLFDGNYTFVSDDNPVPVWLFISIGIGALILVCIVVAVVISKRKKGHTN
ncbi:MAG: C69 family dipeptidase [Coriobacteriia bacterium]|nr:C69 family dipeptidase [Coriobacteriia bacterium]